MENAHPKVCSDSVRKGLSLFALVTSSSAGQREIVIGTTSVRSSKNQSLEEGRRKDAAASRFVVALRLISG